MKILIVNTYHYLRGGESKYALDFADLLQKDGHVVYFFGMKGAKNLPCNEDKYFVSEIDYRDSIKRKKASDAFKVMWKTIYSFEAKRNMSRLLHDIKPDIVHLNTFKPHLTASILPVIYRKNIPMIQTIHTYSHLCPNASFYNGEKPCEECKGKKYFNVVKNKCKKGSLAASLMAYTVAKFNEYLGYDKYISLYIAPSMFLKKKYIDYGFDPYKIINIPNFLNLDSIKPQYSYEDYFLFVGRLEIEKGLFTLIKGFARAAEENKSLKLKIVGTGSMKEIENFN